MFHPSVYIHTSGSLHIIRASERKKENQKQERMLQRKQQKTPTERETEREQESSGAHCVNVFEIRFMYITLLVASHWMLFIDLHTKFRWQEHASHLPLCEFNVYLIQHTMCTQIQPQFWQNRALYRIHTIAVFLSVSLSVCVYMIRCCLCYGCPKQKRISKQMYKNLSTLCQTNQSKMCCRRK